MAKLNVRQLAKKVSDRTDSIVVGNTYFLSSFYDVEGAMVKVLSKSSEANAKKENSCGWASSVNVQVLESIESDYYKIGACHTCNATNLYDNRHMASASVKFGQPLNVR